MDWRTELTEELRRHRFLHVTWFLSLGLLIAANALSEGHLVLGWALFFLGGLALSGAGVRAAYVLAAESY